MKDLDNLKKEITELAKIQFEIDENCGIENNSILFEKYLELREAILNRFGLPESKINAQILHFKSSPSFVEIEGYIGELKRRATEYLLSPVETNEKILLDAIKSRREAEEVIPELGINLHVYSIFVYREILLTKRENPSVIIEAMNIVNDPQILNLLGTIAFAKDLGDHERSMMTDLSLKGVKFLSEFISFYHQRERY